MMGNKLSENLYVIQWLNDKEVVVTTAYQIQAIKHSEKKWYNNMETFKVLRRATRDDISMYRYEGEPFLC